jgi:hypothetical protein
MIVGSGIIGAALYGLAIPGILLVISKANLSWFGEAYSIGSSYGVSRVFFEPVTLGAFGGDDRLGRGVLGRQVAQQAARPDRGDGAGFGAGGPCRLRRPPRATAGRWNALMGLRCA